MTSTNDTTLTALNTIMNTTNDTTLNNTNTTVNASNSINMISTGNLNTSSSIDTNINAGGKINITSSQGINIGGGGLVTIENLDTNSLNIDLSNLDIDLSTLNFPDTVLQTGEGVVNSNIQLNSSSNIVMNAEKTVYIPSESIVGSNALFKADVFMNKLNVYEDFGTHNISYGFRVNEQEALEIFKYDSRLNKSVPIYQIGRGNISAENVGLNEGSTNIMERLINESLNL